MEEENAAFPFDITVLRKKVEVAADVPNWNVFDYCAHHGQILNARWLAWMFPNRISKTMADLCGMRHDTDIGAWERRCS